MTHDAIVVGAGPAGSAAAYYLARAGHSVLLLDRHRFPRDKVCGDCVTPRGVRVLSDMGVLEKLDGHAWRTRGCRIYSSKGGCCTAAFAAYKDYPQNGFVLARRTFDEVLARHAAEAGAEFVEGAPMTAVSTGHGSVRVTYRSDDGLSQARGRYLVAADGGHSRIAREVFGYRSRDARALGVAFRAYFEGVEGIDDHMEIYGEDIVLPGVGWLFPMGEAKANVGVGIYVDDFKKRGLASGDYLERFVRDSIHAGPKLANARQMGPMQAAKLRMGGLKGPVVKDRILLAGDAAALINPLTGEGMMYALESGKFAAEAIAGALAAGGRGASANGAATAPLLAYQRRISTLFGRYFALGSRLIHLAKLPVTVNPGVRLLTASERLGEANLRFWISMF